MNNILNIDRMDYIMLLQLHAPTIQGFRVHPNLNLSQVWHHIPKQFEVGGVMCGKEVNNIGEIHSLTLVPSLLPHQDAYYFDTNVYKHKQVYCGQYDILGSFHTHPYNLTHPSTQDRSVSQQLQVPGCVFTPNNLSCYHGWKDIPLH